MVIGAIRAAVIYLVLIAAMRVMGKRQLGDLQPSELVVTLLIADMAAVALGNTGTPLLSALIPIAVLVSLELLLSGLVLKLPAAEKLMGGHPVVIIKDGKVDQAAMKKLRLTIDDVAGMLREQGVFDFDTIQFAVVETGGKISVALKAKNQPATAADVGAKPSENGVPFLIVSDGKKSDWGLSMCGLSDKWLTATLKKEKCPIEQVFLLTADKSGKTYLIRKEDAK